MRLLALIISITLLSHFSHAQGLNLSPYDLSSGNSYSFSSWPLTSSAGTYPPNMVFATSNTTPVDGTEALSGGWTCAYNLTGRSRFRGGDNSGILFTLTGSAATGCGTGSYPAAAVLAVNTVGNSSLTVRYKTGFISLTGSSTRAVTISLQYRTSNSGAFTTVPNASYTYTPGSSAIDSASFNISMPADCNNQPLVQLKWAFFQGGAGTGSRPVVYLDDVFVIGDTISCNRPNPPVISAQGGTTPCIGNPVTLTSSEPFGNVWSNGDTNRSITIYTSGTYTATTRIGTCRSFASNPLAINFSTRPAIPTITANRQNLVICEGDSLILTSTIGTAYLWNNGDTTRSITIRRPGKFYVIIDNGLNCVSQPSDSVFVTYSSASRRPLFNTSKVDSLSLRLYATQPDTANENENFFSASYGGVYTPLGARAIASEIDFAYSFDTQYFGVLFALDDNISAFDTTFLHSQRRTNFRRVTTRLTRISTFAQLDSLWAASELIQIGDYDCHRVGSRAGGLLVGTKFVFQTVEGRIGLLTITAVAPGNNANSYIDFTVIMQPTNKILSSGEFNFCSNDNGLELIAPVGRFYRWSNGSVSRKLRVTTGGSYFLQLGSVSGCRVPNSDTVFVRISPSPATPSIIRRGDSLYCSDSSATTGNYLWLKDGNISVFTTRKIPVFGEGIYQMYIIGANGCVSDTSAPYIITSVWQDVANAKIALYPNPNSGSFYLTGLPVNTPFTITDVQGAIIRKGIIESDKYAVSSLANGFYILRAGTNTFKVLVQQ